MTPKQAAAVTSYARTGSLAETAKELGLSSVGTVAKRLEAVGVKRNPPHLTRKAREADQDDPKRIANRKRQAAYYRRHHTPAIKAETGGQTWDEKLFEPYAVRKARLAREREL